ncbi:dimethylaniline monooxygenase (N-oxide forming) [Acrodontium crateriforme]|uniref:Dimethylaniline monooxygenase (N-oxide forming) n=1 Tax=Acrodontium crateriforme TaxID=150365 RepID=A0AAQ3M9M0_9PEZI|nr:dimethylaniline monooxygenase (N-oxide forming) [Acrodontium crateriforme]
MTAAYDIVVVGAGWYGLAAAKAASQIMPDEKLAIFESSETPGGTWSKDRLYPGLKSNNMIGTYEYPDFPMLESRYGVKPNTHIPGSVLYQYLTDFAQHFDLYSKIQFCTKVDSIEPAEAGWKLSVIGPSSEKTVITKKLILATGLTSTPNMPIYNGQEKLGVPLFHAKEFCARAETLKQVKNTVVVGGGKSAFDVAYAQVQAGSTVDLVIRDNGHGPVWIAPAFVTPFKKRLDQLLVIRWMTWMAPCPWGNEDGFGGIRGFLHGTFLGRWLVDTFWKVLSGDVLSLIKYDSHPELKKLKPWHSAFWIGSGLSILNYPTPLFDLVKEGKIKVHIGQIDRMEEQTVVLADGTRLQADVVICSTGWKKESPIKFNGLGPQQFGIDVSQEEKEKLIQKADLDVCEMFPRLRDQPKLRFTPKPADPLRLYRFIVPSGYVFSRSIAWVGAVSTVSTSLCAAVQGHWTAAYLCNSLDRLPSNTDEVIEEIMLHTQWGKWRYPCGYGASLPDFVFEGLPYIDMLLRDLGLETHRKKSWFTELTKPYKPQDYAGLVEEWQAIHDRAESKP